MLSDPLTFESVPPIVIEAPPVLPGSGGGILKEYPEDFCVQEVPAYMPSGEGRFLFMHLEKVNMTGAQLVRHLSKTLELPQREIGMAGLKDKRAVTTQWISVPESCSSRIDNVAIDQGTRRVRVHQTTRHTNKLKTGHLKGNRFQIRVRGRSEDGDEALAHRLRVIETHGMPNAFGSQRFGDGETVAIGLDALRGRVIRDKRLLRLGVSALQAFLFNHWLAARARQGGLRRAFRGDWLRKRDTGGFFRCDDPDIDTQRMTEGELTPTGPIYGVKLRAASDDAGQLEQAILTNAGLDAQAFMPVKRIAPGARRDALVFPSESGLHRDEHGVTLSFTLPSGSYATVLLKHLCGPKLVVH